ncbi:four helix bundle protein [candidate division WOR-3 bacterium]|nr:four helix bundle protein [candidate division WOR-3 bacterium]
MKSYKELIAYQKGYQLCLKVYKTTTNYPKQEIYGLVSQMRRAAVSIPSNIAEGYRRKTRKAYTQFLRIALGSCSELETQISLSKDLGFIGAKDYRVLYELQVEVTKLLIKLIASLEK